MQSENEEEQKWDREADVVVVGSGGTGMAAAVEAADSRATVIVVEKGDHVGGLWIAAGGHAIMGATHVLARTGVEDNLESWYEDEMKECDYRAVPELVRTYVEQGPNTMLWMEKRLGLKWADHVAKTTGHRVNRGHYPAPSPDYTGGEGTIGRGISMIAVLLRAVNQQDTPVLLKHRMTRLLRPDPSGPVIGIDVDSEGTNLSIKAKRAVILASGGFTDNTQMCMAWDPRIGPDTYPNGGGPPGLPPYVENTGDALLAGLDIGAGLTDMSFVSFFPIRWGSKSYFVWEPRVWTVPPQGGTRTGLPLRGKGFQHVILVKNDGMRYINEAEGSGAGSGERWEQTFTTAYLNLKERPRNVWAITDADGAEELKWWLSLFQDPDPKKSPALYPDCVAVAQSIQELAGKMGIPGVNLTATVNRYNGFVDLGSDRDFGKPLPLYRISKPPFFGVKACMLRHTQPGGLRINTKAQVLDRADQMLTRGISIDQERVIPHLYAAGECAGFLGWRRTHGKLGHYVTFGRIAGRNAAGEKPWA
ncbi:MAG: FAD-dependent oxidoreductase [Chloroflexi bacterium]|nr:FAD-dependent oxidoreductase [Chloroflexota bacterium]